MIAIHLGLFIMCLSCVRTTEYKDYTVVSGFSGSDQKLQYWPKHSAIMIRKRQANQPASGLSEGGGLVDMKLPPELTSAMPPPLVEKKPPSDSNKAVPATNKTVVPTPAHNETQVNTTESDVKPTPSALDLNKPGVVKRGAIVFGGFLILAGAYYIFYRAKATKTEANNQSTNDANQFRYGVLQSDDRRDNLELSQIPLTMESDDDDDEDLEIFDLGQKKKSLSYVNLETNDADLVFDTTSKENAKDNLLLDIEDGSGSETLINWSNK